MPKSGLDRLQLVQDLLAGLSRLGHFDDGIQVACGAPQALDDLSLRSGPDAHSQPPLVQGFGAADLEWFAQ
jgi:hypothetical protein